MAAVATHSGLDAHVKLVMTLLVRDEADIVDAQLAFHLNAGVDFVLAIDNRSEDGTTEILERYERTGHLRLMREERDDMRQEEWVSQMARLAATELGADWVINADADEFWWPREGSLKDVLALVPGRYGVVRGCWRHFLPRPEHGEFFAERMITRLCRPAFPGDKQTIFHAHQKVAHRADPDVIVEAGNHNALGARLEPIRAWHPIEVLHFSFRSLAQVERKALGGWLRNPDYEPALHQLLLDEAAHERRTEAFYESFVVTDELLERGVGDGSLAVDTRLRDALRALRCLDGSFSLPGSGTDTLLSFPHPDVREDGLYAGEASVLVEIDGVVRAEKRVDALEERLAALEQGPLSRVRRRLATR
jgi:Glycosyl transferase family 2